MSTVRSADGTEIVVDRIGGGPALILIEAAAHYRDFSSFDGLAPLLAEEFTVYTFDRRGRGDSGDTPPYAPQREVEDIAALIAHAGGSAHLYGYSSGALLAMHASAAGLPIGKLVLMEPPLQDRNGPDPLTAELAALADAGRDDDIVQRFNEAIGVPEEYIEPMKASGSWAKMVAVAPTLVYDCLLSDAITTEILGAVYTPTLVLDSLGSSDDLSGSAASVAAQLPNARHRSLHGEWHTVADDVLVRVVAEFLRT